MSVPQSPTSRPKRIIICCDGTWQSATSGKKNVPSNVTRLARELDRVGVDDKGQEWQQVVWYDSGVGTTSLLGRTSEGATGSGLEMNVIEAYNFVALNWEPGDKVYCFGFSRGAFTARAIAGLISDIGICEPHMLQHFYQLWGLYKANKKGRFYGSEAYWEFLDGKVEEPVFETPRRKRSNDKWEHEAKGDWARTLGSREIEIVGVYDTVRALGMPSLRGVQVGSWFHIGPEDYEFYNAGLNRNIKRAYHALALDERREAFTPTLFHICHDYPFKDIDSEHAAFERAFKKWHWASTNRKISIEEKRQIQREYDAARHTIEELEYKAIKDQENTVDKYKCKWLQLDPKTHLDAREEAHKDYNNARTELVRMEEHHKPPPELSQVWFPGVHINVGGGSSDTLNNQGDMEELADIAFSWMLDQIRPHLNISWTVHEQYDKEMSDHFAELNKEARQEEERLQQESDERKNESYWKTGYRWALTSAQTVAHTAVESFNSYVRRIENEMPKNQKFFTFGWGTGTIIDSYTWTYVANGCLARTPNGYEQAKGHSKRDRTHEYVHPVVGYRMYRSRKKYKDAVIAARNAKNKDEQKRLDEERDALKKQIYNPIGMKSRDQPVAIRRKDETGEWVYEFHGNGEPLPEWNLRPNKKSHVLSYKGLTEIPEDDALWYAVNTPSYERCALHKDKEAKAYLRKLDEINGYKISECVRDGANSDLDAWFKRGEITAA